MELFYLNCWQVYEIIKQIGHALGCNWLYKCVLYYTVGKLANPCHGINYYLAVFCKHNSRNTAFIEKNPLQLLILHCASLSQAINIHTLYNHLTIMLLPNECTFKDSLLLKEFLNWRLWFCFYLPFPLQTSEVSNIYVSDSKDIRLDCMTEMSKAT